MTFIIIFIVVCSLLILFLVTIIAIIVYRYQRKQNDFFENMEKLKHYHENDMLKSKLEIQEQTFQNISREIHDNIGQKLTLAKLHLNTLVLCGTTHEVQRVNDAVTMIGEAINDLSDLSRSMSSEIILSNGLIKGLEFEINQLNKTGLYNLKLLVVGEPVFLDTNAELILFRITQEALNNIMKHAGANSIIINLLYEHCNLTLTITDNGRGFLTDKHQFGNGLINMEKRATMLNGKFELHSKEGEGTSIKITIPIYEPEKKI